jgi:SAM-dependent methyltransferase
MENICPLCNYESKIFYENKNQKFYLCNNCEGIFQDKMFFLDKMSEKQRYLKHNNDVYDIGYQNFVSPITNSILTDFTSDHKGLDFGSGTNSVIYKILKDSNFQINQYDPFFNDNFNLLNQKFDYIACCEVIEHFQNPDKEFKLLKNLLNSNGKLYCMTDIYDNKTNFGNWYYKNDPTHVFIYQETTFKWIRKHFEFTDYKINNRLITFTN